MIRRKQIVVWSLIGLLSLTIAISLGYHLLGISFPQVDAISDMTAVLYQFGEEKPFSVPRAYWQPIIEALQPARIDFDPYKWVVLGRLSITVKNGRTLHVLLFSVGEGPGAFKVGNVYYRGGYSTVLRQALHDASTAFKK